MDSMRVLVDIIESAGIRPMPTKQMFGCVLTGYQVNGNTVVVRKHEKGGDMWLRCSGSKVIIIPRVVNKALADDMVVDLSDPHSFEMLRNYIQS